MESSSIRLHLADANETRNLGQKLGRSLSPGDVILLEGNLGTGKTTLVQGLGEALGIPESIESPTFTLINEYTTGTIPLYHLDLYRLEAAEIEELNLETYWEGIEVEPGIVAIEWAERLPYKPKRYLQIYLNYTEIGDRFAELIPTGEKLDFWEIIQ